MRLEYSSKMVWSPRCLTMELTLNAQPYAALDSGSREIRLLALNPGQFHSRIECYLKHVTLEDSPTYEALSYCWGDPTKTKQISLDGCWFFATESLEIALRYLRYQDTPRILWIDALCINQADNRERSQQVRLMKEIYRGASRVIVWLGEEEGGADGGVRECPVESIHLDEQEQLDPKPAAPTRAADQRCVIDAVDIIPLYRRPWWQRIWVIQEVAVATRTAVTVQYGRHTQEWHKLRGSWGAYFFRGGLEDTSLTQSYETISSLKNMIWFGGRAALTDLLEQFRYWKATDPRDKIYALIGLSCGSGSDFQIDYTKPVERVYMDFVIHLISHDKNLHILTHSSVARSLGHLPSWAPDWSCDKEDSLVRESQPLQWRLSRCKRCYAASADVEARVSLREPGVLLVSGFIFDTVQSIGDKLQPDDASCFGFTMRYPQSTAMDEWETMALSTVEGSDPYFGQEGRFEAFCRTLIADVGDDGVRAEPSMFNHFLSWCKRPRLPSRESMALKVARSLGHVPLDNIQEAEAQPIYGNKGNLSAECLQSTVLQPEEKEDSENRDQNTNKHKREIIAGINEEFESVYELKKERLAKLDEIFALTKEGMFKLLNDTFESDRASKPLCSRMKEASVGRRLIISDNGYMGIVAPNTERGDLICILFGGEVPFILRAVEGGRYRLIGECYVHGIMDGEALDDEIKKTSSEHRNIVQEFMLV